MTGREYQYIQERKQYQFKQDMETALNAPANSLLVQFLVKVHQNPDVPIKQLITGQREQFNRAAPTDCPHLTLGNPTKLWISFLFYQSTDIAFLNLKTITKLSRIWISVITVTIQYLFCFDDYCSCTGLYIVSIF